MSLYWLSINLRGIQDICQGTLNFGTYDSVTMSYYYIPAVVQLEIFVVKISS